MPSEWGKFPISFCARGPWKFLPMFGISFSLAIPLIFGFGKVKVELTRLEWGEGLMWFCWTQRKWIKYPRSSRIKIIIKDGMLFRKGEFLPQNISILGTKGLVEHLIAITCLKWNLLSIWRRKNIEKSRYPRKLTKFYDRYDAIRFLLSFQLVSFHLSIDLEFYFYTITNTSTTIAI